jgi:hypothetical protein
MNYYTRASVNVLTAKSFNSLANIKSSNSFPDTLPSLLLIDFCCAITTAFSIGVEANATVVYTINKADAHIAPKKSVVKAPLASL